MTRTTIIATLLLLTSCQTTEPQTTWVTTCEAYASALNTLSAARDADRLDATTINRIDKIERLVTPICDAPAAPTSTILLNRLDNAVYELSSYANHSG